MIQLRPYQTEAVSSVSKEWRRGNRRVLLSLPTGTGKTIVFATLATLTAKANNRTLILAHRDELLDQAADKLFKVSGIVAEKEKAEFTTVGRSPLITVGSVQTLAQPKRLEKFKPDEYKLIIVDEAHHVMSDSYQRVLNHFENAFVVGVTATPDRGDKKNLAEYFDALAYEYSIRDAIKNGYLCPVKAQLIPLDIDLTGVKTSAGDYSLDSSGLALEPYLEKIADEMVTACKGRKTVVFLPLISTSCKFCELLCERGLRAKEVNGNSENRKEILEEFDKGGFDILCNSMLLTEGWDCPSVDCVVVLRPTKVRALYQQMVGRGMRLADGKKDLLILDFLWMTSKHDLCRAAGLFAKDKNIEEKIQKKLASGEETDLEDAEKDAQKDAAKEREDALAVELAAQMLKKRRMVNPLDFAISIADDDLADYQPSFRWEFEAPSENQLKTLENFGFDKDSIPTKGYAAHLLNVLISRRQQGLATPKQVRFLKRAGYTDIENISFDDASSIIGTYINSKQR